MRSSRVVFENVSKRLRAAATALSTSALEPSEMRAKGSSVAGLMTSMVLGVGGVHPLAVDIELKTFLHSLDSLL